MDRRVDGLRGRRRILTRAENLAGRALVLVAIVAFASGAALWLGLSPLWVNLALGGVLVNVSLVNVSLVNDCITDAVRHANPPLSLTLLVLAGAYWTPPPLLPAIAVSAGFVLIRSIGRMAASWLVAQRLGPMRVDTGRGLLG